MRIERVTTHAIDQTVERFGIKRNLAENWIRTRLNKASFVSVIVNKDGGNNRLFVFERVAFILDPEVNRVITVYEPAVPATIHEKARRAVVVELRKIERKERSIERRNTIEIYKCRVEMAELQLRQLRARSTATKQAIAARLSALESFIAELEAEVYEVKRNKTRIAKGVAAYI